MERVNACGILISILIIFICNVTCGGSNDSRIEELAQEYARGNKLATKELESLVLEKASLAQFDPEHLSITEHALFIKDGSDIDIEYPYRESFTLHEDAKESFFHRDKEILAYSDGKRMGYRDGDNDEPDIVTTGEKDSIHAVMVYGRSIIYYRNFQIFSFDILTKKNELMLNESFYPQVRNYFNVMMHRNHNLLCIVAGIAGSYRASLIDLASRKMIVKDLPMAASKAYMQNGFLYYIGGATGGWDINRYDVHGRAVKQLARLNDIAEFEFLPQGYLYENSKGLWISDYSGKTYRLPLSCKLMGKCAEAVVLEYKNTIHCADFSKLLDAAELFGRVRPDTK